jgi:hypothetical protein
MELASSNQSTSSQTSGTTSPQSDLSQKVTALTHLTAPQLRAEWRRLHRYQPPRLSRDLLVRCIAYRIQELAYGGLSKATQQKLTALTRELQKSGSIAPDPRQYPRPGTRLVREWCGRTHTVVVTDNGLEYAGGTYSSLSKIAQVITGAHWSGPRFFGLNRSGTPGVQSECITSDAIGEREHSNA